VSLRCSKTFLQSHNPMSQKRDMGHPGEIFRFTQFRSGTTTLNFVRNSMEPEYRQCGEKRRSLDCVAAETFARDDNFLGSSNSALAIYIGPGKKKGPSCEGPICLGSLLCESF
jgi:hypothetical protein